MAPKQWFRFENAANEPTAVDIHIIDIIGSWFDQMANVFFNEKLTLTAKAFVEQLAALPATVKALRVHINSPGGDVQAAVNIANALREQRVSKGRTVDTIVDGLAASSASIIAMAGESVRIADNGLLMIHNPWNIVVGNAAQLRKTADLLDVVRGQIIATYQWHSPLSEAELAALMDAETWMDADEAVARGLATEKLAGLKAAALLDPQAVATLKVPEAYRARVDALLAPTKPAPAPPAPAAAADVLRLCREGECLDIAEGLIGASATLDQVTAKVAETRAAKAAVTEREAQIRATCALAQLPELASDYIAGGMPLETVKAQLVTVRAKLDAAVRIDGRLTPKDQHGAVTNPLNPADIYAEYNRPRKD